MEAVNLLPGPLRALQMLFSRICSSLYSGSSNANMQAVLARVRGPFTPSQWLELEHQALIYKYLVANVPIPATLLIPIKRSLGASGFPPLSAGSFASVGWGPFHLGYSGNADPEPGRCRRTDGKKWRCSRDAVADQKYCERHINRGRHRSRKHVEGQTGHAAKAVSVITSSQSASAVPDGISSGSLTNSQQQSKSLQSNITDPFHTQSNGVLINKEDQNDPSQNSKVLSVLSPVNQNSMNNLFPVSKQHNPFEETSSGRDFGFISTDSLLNPPSSSFSDNISFIPNSKPEVHSHPLRHFIDVCPKTQSDRSTVTWPDVEETQLNKTQLAISIPMACSDFSSSSPSNYDKLPLSPLKLSREYELVNTGLGVGLLNEVCHQQVSWKPVSWEASMAGPLGEVLTSTNPTPKNQSKNCLSSSSLNLLSDGWDSSCQLESSPTGVLQKASFGSLSSSTGSSPRAENLKIHESTGSLCDDLLGSTILSVIGLPIQLDHV
ncbi:Growth-regulating factor [Musa troglodytarum]|uniref:Growth-regulating factor n=1 Tax=Musa troglodytarum TaxID=320322 RepID=A0A9E7HGG8_9LILI|nr:Growth-regulating factor [Musa troglodytarum]